MGKVALYGERMTHRMWVRIPEKTYKEIMARAEQEQLRTGEKVDPGTIARRLIHAGLGEPAVEAPSKRRAPRQQRKRAA